MSEEKTYLSINGFIQFPPETRNVGDDEVTSLTISGNGLKGQPYCKISVWNTDVKAVKGDFVAAHGSYTNRAAENGKLYHNLNAYSLVITPNILEDTRDKKVRKTSTGDEADIF